MLLAYVIGSIAVLVGISVFFGAPYVPSHRKEIKRLLSEVIPIAEGDTLLDIGSGDGVVLREASKRGAKAVGYEIHPLFVGISKLASLGDSRVHIQWANAWTTPFPDSVTLVYAFSTGRDAKKLAATMQHEVDRLERQLTLVCYGNALPERSTVQTSGAFFIYTFEPLHRR